MKRTLLLLFLLLISALRGQTIEGTIKDKLGNNVSLANVFIKKERHQLGFEEFALAKDGYFRYELKKKYDSLYVDIQSVGYEKRVLPITKSKLDFVYIEVVLAAKTTVLNEVVVTSTKSYEVKKDTISFNVEAYTDGSERKIEEVIKKLPGIEVNEQSGRIKYKGRPIETVTLDGDNLFGFNYTLGTKNISVDMVEQIEAIDNYSENPLLKGIEQGGKVALNLKLKKRKTDFSGNVDNGLGLSIENKGVWNFNSNILGINKLIKSFSTFSRNNIGVNHTPFDYFSFNLSVEQLMELNHLAKKIIPETRFSDMVDNDRTNINNQFFGNFNAIFKLNPRLSAKTNLYYLQDRITTNQLFENQFVINNEKFRTSDKTFISKKPQQSRGDLEIKYNTSKTSLLEYNLKIRQENIRTPTNIIQNQTDEFSSLLITEDFYLKQDLQWTKKLSERKALQISLFHSLNDLPQSFSISPSLFDDSTQNDTQESKFKKAFLEGKATYLGSGKNGDKYTFTIGATLIDSPFESRLFNSDEILSENSFDYKQSIVSTTGVYNYYRGVWQISPSYSVRLLTQKLDLNIENREQNQNNIVFEPALNVKYVLNLNSFLLANLGYSQNTNTERYFFLNQVLIDNRTTVENLPSLELQNSQRYSLLYFNNDLYNQFQLNTSISYQKSTGNFFTNQNITEKTTQIEYFFLPTDNSYWNMSMHVSKYIPFLESTVKLSSNYSISNFSNIVNNSNLRINKTQFFNNSLFWKTALDIPINFENTFTYQYSHSESENQQAFINKSWQDNFKIVVKPNKKWLVIISSDYYLPSTNQSNPYFF